MRLLRTQRGTEAGRGPADRAQRERPAEAEDATGTRAGQDGLPHPAAGEPTHGTCQRPRRPENETTPVRTR